MNMVRFKLFDFGQWFCKTSWINSSGFHDLIHGCCIGKKTYPWKKVSQNCGNAWKCEGLNLHSNLHKIEATKHPKIWGTTNLTKSRALFTSNIHRAKINKITIISSICNTNSLDKYLRFLILKDRFKIRDIIIEKKYKPIWLLRKTTFLTSL